MLTTIDPHGDILLLLSSGTKLLVSSKILSTASPVFRAMFSPRFREGSSLDPTSPTEVALPDDAPSALITICNILHFRHDLVSPDQSFDALVDIALAADKYDLAGALGPWREIWLRKLPAVCVCDGQSERDMSGEREGQEIFMRYVLSDKEGFEAITRIAILWSDAADGWGFEALPDKITSAIAATRLTTIGKLLDIAEHYRLKYQSPDIKCKVRAPISYLWGGGLSTQPPICDALTFGSLIRHYSSLGIFPMPLRPYRGFSVVGLARGLKGLSRFVDFNAGHGACQVAGQIGRCVDEVLECVKGLDVGKLRGGGVGRQSIGGGKGGCGLVWVNQGGAVPDDVNAGEVTTPVQYVAGSLFGGGG